MKIWYDACTGKHVRYGTAVARRRARARAREIGALDKLEGCIRVWQCGADD